MRIVLVNKFWYPKGGSERYTFLLKDLLESKGHEVVPFAMEDERNLPTPWAEHFVPHVDFWDAADAVPDQTRALTKLSRVLWSREAAGKFGALLDEVRPDIVHLQNFAHQISPSILPECTKRGIPAVWTVHDYKAMCPNYRMYTRIKNDEKTFSHSQEYWNVSRGELRTSMQVGAGVPCERCKGGRYWNAVRYNCMGSRGASVAVALEMTLHHAILNVYGKHIAAIVAPSRFMAERLREWGWKGRVETVPNFVEKTDGHGSARMATDNTDKHPVVLFVGRLTEEKGIEDFLEAARRLPNIPFAVIGDGPLMESCKLQAANRKHVRLHGALPPHATAENIARAAIVVVPSRWYENAPYVVLEAMAAGVPVIASAIGGLPELVRDHETGILISPRDPAALAESVDMLYADGALRRAYGDRARAVTMSEYGSERHYERLTTLYAELRASRGY